MKQLYVPAIKSISDSMLTLCMLAADLSAQGIACANSLDSDQAQQNIGLELKSKLFDSLILILQKWVRKQHVLQLFFI